jgi:hypothetical protein
VQKKAQREWQQRHNSGNLLKQWAKSRFLRLGAVFSNLRCKNSTGFSTACSEARSDRYGRAATGIPMQ